MNKKIMMFLGFSFVAMTAFSAEETNAEKQPKKAFGHYTIKNVKNAFELNSAILLVGALVGSAIAVSYAYAYNEHQGDGARAHSILNRPNENVKDIVDKVNLFMGWDGEQKNQILFLSGLAGAAAGALGLQAGTIATFATFGGLYGLGQDVCEQLEK